MYFIEYACLSNRGKVRASNQDNFVCLQEILPMNANEPMQMLTGKEFPEKPLLFGVFDGMGGEEMGDAASFIAADTAAHWNIAHRALSMDSLCREANLRIIKFSQTNSLRSCGTTAAMILFDKAGAVVLNIGDSRIYRLNKKTFTQLSTDHVLPAYQKKKPPLLQYLGISDTEIRIEPAVCEVAVVAGDTFLICSDGVTDMLCEDEIKRILKDNAPAEACSLLYDAAMNAGGRDNITGIVIGIYEDTASSSKIKRFFKKVHRILHRIP